MTALAKSWPLAVALVVAPAHAVTQPRNLDDVHFVSWGRTARSYLDAPAYFLARAELITLSVTPPPANSDPATRAELDELLRLQASRTPAQQRSIERHRDDATVLADLEATAGARPAAIPRTRALLDHVERDVRLAVFHAKRRFERARPEQIEPRLHPSIAVPPHPAYPSGHAIASHVAARVLALLAPGRSAALLESALEVGHEREIAGVHYPSDGVASRTLGDAIFARLEANAHFQRELAAARGEWH